MSDRAWEGAAGVVWPAAVGPALTAPGASGEAYHLVRFGGRVRWVVSRSLSPRSRRRVLLYANRLRAPSRRAARSALASTVLLGAGAAGATVVGVADDRDRLRLRTRVAAELGRPVDDVHLTFAVHDRDGAPRPTVLAVDAAGAPLLFLKLGSGPLRRSALERERAAVERVAAHVPAGVLVPRARLWVREGRVTVLGLEPLPADVDAVAVADPDATWPALDALVAAHPRPVLPLAASPWLQRVCADLLELGRDARPEVRDLGERGLLVVERLLARHGDRVLPHGLRHGDWSSWNLAWSGPDAEPRLVVWDFEHGEPCAPLALDRHNWFFARATSIEGVDAADAGRRLLADARPERAGEVDLDGLTARLFLLDMAARRSVLAAGGERRSVRAADGLLTLLADDLP